MAAREEKVWKKDRSNSWDDLVVMGQMKKEYLFHRKSIWLNQACRTALMYQPEGIYKRGGGQGIKGGPGREVT